MWIYSQNRQGYIKHWQQTKRVKNEKAPHRVNCSISRFNTNRSFSRLDFPRGGNAPFLIDEVETDPAGDKEDYDRQDAKARTTRKHRDPPHQHRTDNDAELAEHIVKAEKLRRPVAGDQTRIQRATEGLDAALDALPGILADLRSLR